MTLPATVRVNVNALFPSQAVGAGSIVVSKSNGIYTISDDWTLLADVGVIAAPQTGKQVKVYDPAAKTYGLANITELFSAGVAIAPTANTTNKGISVTQSGPISAVAVAGPINFNLINVTSFNAATTAGVKFADFGEWPSAVSAFRVNFTVGGANITANTEPMMAVLGHTRITTASTVFDAQGATGITYANVAVTGAIQGVVGAIVIDNGGSLTGRAVGVFAEADILTGGSAAKRSGVHIDSEGNLTATGADDTAISIASIRDTASFKLGILLDTTGGGVPIQTTGSFFTSNGAFTLANFIDGTNATITGNIFKFPKYLVQGSNGFTSIGSGTVTPDAPLTVMSNTAATVAVAAGTNLHLVGADATSNIFTFDSFGGQPIFASRRANTSLAGKTGIVATDILFNININGWDTAAYSGSGGMKFVSDETWSAANHGMHITFQVTASGGGAAGLETVRFHGSGGASLGNASVTTDPGAGILLSTATMHATSTVGALPAAAAGNKGQHRYVTDANATFTAGIGAIVAAGGANVVPVFSDGTNWRIG